MTLMRANRMTGLRRHLFLRPSTAAIAAAAIAASLVACDTNKILAVTDPDVARPASITSVTALPSLRAGAVGDFGNAYNGTNADVEQVHAAGLLSDEFINTETFPTRIEIDQRTIQLDNGSLSTTYYDLQRARASAERAAAAYAQFAKNAVDSTGIGEVLALGGLSYVLLAENYCGSVPVSSQNPDGSFSYGDPLSTTQLLDSALSKANQALGTLPPASIKSLAQVVKGRALLDKGGAGDYAAAAAAVAGVPVTFQYLFQHSETTTRQNNGTWSLTANVGRFGEADKEAGTGLPFQSDGNVKTNPAPDPRVADSVANRRGSKVGFDNSTIQFVQMKYPLRASPIVIADGVEAQLIQAEATLNGGNAAGALATLNGLRSNAGLLALRGYATGSLPPLAAQATANGQLDQLFKERAYWLYLTSHRLGDLRRLVRQYGRPSTGTGSVFPTGNYFKGGTYGTDVNLPVPQNEQNNPKFKASACVKSQA